MGDSKVNRNHLYEKIFYSILAIFLTIFSVILYNKGNSNLIFKVIAGVILIIIVLYALSKLYQVIKNTDYLIQIVLSIFFIDILIMNFIDIFLQSLQSFTLFLNFIEKLSKKLIKLFISIIVKLIKSFFYIIMKLIKSFFDIIVKLIESFFDIIVKLIKSFKHVIVTYKRYILIMLVLLSSLIYFINYHEFQNDIINSILVFIFILSILRYKKPILILIITGFLVSIISYLLGLVQSTDFPIAAWIFLFGLVFPIIENIEKFIKLDKYYSKDNASIKNDEIIKRNKVILNFIIGSFFVVSYITFKLIIACVIEKTKQHQFNENLAKGFLLIITNEILIIIYLFILSKLLQKISKHSKTYDNQKAVGLFYSILTFGIKKKVTPKVVKKIDIGNKDIDQINPEVFIKNIKEVPKNIHILLSKVEDIPTARNLLIIYPNKDVYICKFTISKNIVKRISKAKLANTVNK